MNAFESNSELLAYYKKLSKQFHAIVDPIDEWIEETEKPFPNKLRLNHLDQLILEASNQIVGNNS